MKFLLTSGRKLSPVLIRKAGFEEVTLTPRSGDLGRDVIAVKRGIATVRVIDQVKAYKPSLLVTAKDVRALMGVLQTDGASKGFVTTTSDFAPRVRSDPLYLALDTFAPRTDRREDTADATWRTGPKKLEIARGWGLKFHLACQSYDYLMWCFTK